MDQVLESNIKLTINCYFLRRLLSLKLSVENDRVKGRFLFIVHEHVTPIKLITVLLIPPYNSYVANHDVESINGAREREMRRSVSMTTRIMSRSAIYPEIQVMRNPTERVLGIHKEFLVTDTHANFDKNLLENGKSYS